MSDTTNLNAMPAAEYRACFGSAPGGQDARDECAKWQQVCAKLIAEREQLRAELAKAQAAVTSAEKALLAEICKGFKLELTREEILAQAGKEPSLERLIAELEREASKSASL